VKFSLLKRFGMILSACFGFWPILLVAQPSDATQNLADCKNGWESCDRSKLNKSEFADVAHAEHRREVSNCRNSFQSCDRSKLTPQETIALALADHQQNVADCKNGMTSCDHSRLTPSEASESSGTVLGPVSVLN
jgi:hypothetical protein